MKQNYNAAFALVVELRVAAAALALALALALPRSLSTWTLALVLAWLIVSALAAPAVGTRPVPVDPEALRSALPPPWHHGVFMDIFVRDSDGIGDLRSLTDRLGDGRTRVVANCGEQPVRVTVPWPAAGDRLGRLWPRPARGVAADRAASLALRAEGRAVHRIGAPLRRAARHSRVP